MKKLLLIFTCGVLLLSSISCNYISYDINNTITVRTINSKYGILCEYYCSDGRTLQDVIINDSCGKYMIGDTIRIVKYSRK